MKLYHAKQSRSLRPRWLLEELGVPYEVARLDMAAKEHKSPAYLQVHPLGKVPALGLEEGPLFESAALCLHLADCHPEAGLAPAVGTYERGLYYQWMLFAVTDMDAALLEIWVHRHMHPDDAAWKARADAALDRAALQLDVLERALEGREYLLGRFTAADVVVGSLLLWASMLGVIGERPNLRAFVARMKARPALQRALAD